jgi:hypothetical protein
LFGVHGDDVLEEYSGELSRDGVAETAVDADEDAKSLSVRLEDDFGVTSGLRGLRETVWEGKPPIGMLFWRKKEQIISFLYLILRKRPTFFGSIPANESMAFCGNWPALQADCSIKNCSTAEAETAFPVDEGSWKLNAKQRNYFSSPLSQWENKADIKGSSCSYEATSPKWAVSWRESPSFFQNKISFFFEGKYWIFWKKKFCPPPMYNELWKEKEDNDREQWRHAWKTRLLNS